MPAAPSTPPVGEHGAAGATYIFADFPGATFPATWHHSALADALADAQLVFDIDIISFFNSDIDDDPNCLTGQSWYYGFDNNNAANEIDFHAVVMHEIAHGLGFSEFIDEGTGAGPLGLDDVFMRNMFDRTTGLFWDQMTDAERLASQVNFGNLVWAGPSVTADAPQWGVWLRSVWL